ATEQIDESAFANQLHRGCPGLGLSHRFDDDVEERSTFVLNDAHEVGATRNLEHFSRSQLLGDLQATLSTPGDGHVAIHCPSERDEHQADWSGAENQDA